MKIKLALITAVFYLAQLQVSAQVIDSTLKHYSDQFQQERLYFHFDKSAYFPGDTVWFKTYITAGWGAAGISKNLYTDWSEPSGKPLQHGIQPIVLSSAYGQMVIPGDFKGNALHLRAYTGWMLNFDTAFLYDNDVMVIQNDAATNKNIPQHKVMVTLFAEGGDLVQNLMSAVAFKAENQSGRPIDITGALKNKKGEVIDSVSCVHDGMGKFFLTPEAGEAYTVSWKDNEGDSGIAPVPAALPAGVTLKVSPSEKKVSYHVERSEGAPDELKTLHLVATQWQQEVYNSTINLAQATSATNAIPSAQLPSGLVTVTLFNASWKPVAERVVFVNNNDYSFTTGITAKGDLQKRGRNEVELDVPEGTVGNLSVSVTDAGLLSDNSDNIISHFLLASEIKGRVYNPYYYFSNTSDSVKDALDLVMLTNGWRRYKWNDVVAGTAPTIKYAKDTAYVNIKGQVSVKGNNPVAEGAMVSLNIRSSNPDDSLSTVLLETLGPDMGFKLSPGVFHDSLNIYYRLQSNKKTQRRGFVAFTSTLLENAVGNNAHKAFYTPQEDRLAVLQSLALKSKQDELLKLLQATTLKDVTVKTKVKTREQIIDEAYTSPNFRGGGNNYTFDIANDFTAKSVYSIANYLTDKVPSLEIKQTPNTVPPENVYYYRPRVNLQGQLTGRVSVYLDEMLTDEETIESIPLDQVGYIKFFKSGALAFNDDNPSLVVYLKKGGDNDTTSELKHAVVIGYTPAKDFYNPDYSNPAAAKQGVDIRSTLYWNPYVLTSAGKNKVKIIFYNNDISKQLRIIVEGMGNDGRLTRAEKVIE